MKPALRFVACVTFGLLVAQPCSAAVRVVTTSADIMAPGSLRFEVNAAAVGDVIQIPATLGAGITLTLGELLVTKSLEIQGPNPSAFSIVNFTGRVFHFHSVMVPVTAKVSGVQITGKVTGASGMNGVEGSPHGTSGESAQGGGVMVDADCLVTISNCVFNGCQVIGGNGGHAYNDPQLGKSLSSRGGNGGHACGGAALNFAGNLIIETCTFMNNLATAGSGGDGFKGGLGGIGGDARGGAICTEYGGTALKVINSTFYANTGLAGYGGAGGDAEPGSPGMANGGDGGSGGHAKGGAIFLTRGSPDESSEGFVHDTIVANGIFPGQGGKGGSGINGGANGLGYSNGIGWGGGLARSSPPVAVLPNPDGYVPVGNTIMAENFVGWRYTTNGSFLAEGPDVFGSISSNGFNFFGVKDVHANGFHASDQTGTLTMPIFPILGPLQLNGGQTPTLAPLACSPLIDKGSKAMLATDQTDQIRPKPVTSGPFPADGSDIGSVELQSYPDDAAPILNIEKEANTVVLTWPANACYILEQSLTLQNDWVDAPPSTVIGSMRRLVVFPLDNHMFFRLRRP